MNTELSPEALEFGRAARDALSATGTGEGEAEKTLAALGAWDLKPRDDADDLEAAAVLCRAVGYCSAGEDGIDFPVARRLAHGLQGHGPGTGELDALGLTLPCWTLLGMLDRAIELTVGHVTVREQFGQPLSKLQGVQFQLTDAEVQRAGLDILAAYTLWSVGSAQFGVPGDPGSAGTALDDALALRAAALEAADVVFRVAHQLHGALGFCDEAPVSWLSRRSQPLRREPCGLSATRALLTERIGRRGLTGLFDLEHAQ
jgi:alkylation response protein AidB-like acyl-CoA dehydrogenase